MKTQHLILALLIYLSNSYQAQSQTDTLHFTLTTSNNISIPIILNGSDTLDFMFHTAASGVTITEEALTKANSISFANDADTVKSWGGASTARFSQANTLSMGNQVWDDITIWENKHSGPGTDGKFGFNLFKDYIVEINFTHSYLVLHSEVPKLDSYKRIDILNEHGLMFVKGNSFIEEDTISNRFLIHSGYGGAILFDDEFVSKNSLGEKLTITSESELKDSYGNILKTKKGILPQFALTDFLLTDVPIGFFEGAIGRQKMSVMGGEFLKKFDLIFDLPNEVAYLTPSKYY